MFFRIGHIAPFFATLSERKIVQSPIGSAGDTTLNVNGFSSYDAAHLYLTHIEAIRAWNADPTNETTFEVITEGRIHQISGTRRRRGLINGDRNGRAAGFSVQPAADARGLNPDPDPWVAGAYGLLSRERRVSGIVGLIRPSKRAN